MYAFAYQRRGGDEERKQILEALNRVHPNDRQRVLTAVLWFVKSDTQVADKIALIHNFAMIPPNDRAFVAEAVSDNREFTAHIAKQMLTKTNGISWTPIINTLKKIPERERTSFLVQLYGLSPS